MTLLTVSFAVWIGSVIADLIRLNVFFTLDMTVLMFVITCLMMLICVLITLETMGQTSLMTASIAFMTTDILRLIQFQIGTTTAWMIDMTPDMIAWMSGQTSCTSCWIIGMTVLNTPPMLVTAFSTDAFTLSMIGASAVITWSTIGAMYVL